MVTVPLTAARRYRFGPLDRSGWLLGLGPPACIALGVGLVLGGAAFHAAHSVLAAVPPVGLAALVAFGRYDGRALHEWIEPLWGWAVLRHQHAAQWMARVPLLGSDPSGADLPPCLVGLELHEVAGRAGAPRPTGLGVVVDRQRQLLSATLRVHGGAFALLEHEEQARVLDGWGAAMGGFCRERGAVTRVSWSEWAAPASLDEHLAFVRDQRGADRNAALEDYLELVGRAGPLTFAHETLITVTVDRRRVRSVRAPDADAAALDALLEELRRFTSRLEQAGFLVDPPLAPGELALVVRLRSDPSSAPRLATRRDRLAEQARVVSPHNTAPLAVDTTWRHVLVDQALHRCFWIAEWPRLEVPGDWLATLLLHPGGIRTVTVVHEPVPPSRSRRAVDREATRLASDEDERVRRGFRVRAQHRRAESEVLARETEIVAGYPELRFAGFLTVTAFDEHSLDEQAGEWEQAAAQGGLELRALDGQHDLAFAAGLPLGRLPDGRGRP
jgi:hypothetical protein